MNSLLSVLLGLWIPVMASGGIPPQENGSASDDLTDREVLPSVGELSETWQPVEGFQPYFLDKELGQIWFSIDRPDEDFLLAWGLGTGLGSNPVGLDRGQLGDQLVCQFRRTGRKVLLVARNLDYRALSDQPAEQRAVTDSFAESVLWSGEVAAEDENGSFLVNATSLLTRDLNGIASQLQKSGQGDYSLDPQRSVLHLERCKSFPDNTELESTLTFSGTQPGRLVSGVTPSPENVTLRQHVSLVRLPDDDYHPRDHHPHSASMFIRFSDYAAPLEEPLQKRWILRHRLQKQDPDAELSPPVEPIVYYVDPGAPRPIREALIEGASWWNEAFEAAGFQDAFQVRVLPQDADPMDVRYNVIQWVHRSTRGWSYGGSVIDPRTGEIIKGHVTLGSLRVRQDRLIFDALPRSASRAEDPSGCGMSGVTEDTTLAGLSRRNDPVEVALARIRQLSAHEVGHTLGFVHNFAASTWGDRASVMDYPAPRIGITETGELDLSDAYGTGIGQWDKWSVEFAYREFADSVDESTALNDLVERALATNMVFVSDADARPAAAAHPDGNLWDNGSDAIEQLRHVMRVRRVALRQLGVQNLRPEDPQSELEQLLVPVYLHHRFQIEATAKMIGGYRFSPRLAGRAAPLQPVSESRQLQALEALLGTLHPAELVVPSGLWMQLAPGPAGHREGERFGGNTHPVFDREYAATVAADLTLGNLLNPRRVSRLAMARSGGETFDVQRLMVSLIDYCWQNPGPDERMQTVSRIIRQRLTDHLLELATHPEASINARTAARFGIDRVRQYLGDRRMASRSTRERWFARMMLEQLQQFDDRPWPTVELPTAPASPPGSPIGNPLDR